MTPKELADVRRKLKMLNHAKELGNISATCRYLGISRETFHRWKRGYAHDGERALGGRCRGGAEDAVGRQRTAVLRGTTFMRRRNSLRRPSSRLTSRAAAGGGVVSGTKR